MTILSQESIKNSLASFSGWEIDEDEIEKTFQFPTFMAAIGFVNKVSELAEEKNHHPEMKINYNKVKIELSTHEEDGISEKDVELAKAIENI